MEGAGAAGAGVGAGADAGLVDRRLRQAHDWRVVLQLRDVAAHVERRHRAGVRVADDDGGRAVVDDDERVGCRSKSTPCDAASPPPPPPPPATARRPRPRSLRTLMSERTLVFRSERTLGGREGRARTFVYERPTIVGVGIPSSMLSVTNVLALFF